jgi:small conductance mechanosensitive channel
MQLQPQTTPADTTASVAVESLNQRFDEAWSMLQAGEYQGLFNEMVQQVIGFLPDLLKTVILLTIFWGAYRTLNPLLTRLLRRSAKIEEGVSQLLMKTFRVVFFALAGIMILQQLGFKITALLAGFGIAGIAVGFAARDTFENFIAGITIFMDQPFRVGDNIEVDGTFGTVSEITLRSTRIRTLKYEIVVMPNLQMINQKVTNHTLTGPLRVDVDFAIAYKERPQQAREIVMQIPEGDERLVGDRPPTVVVTQMNDSSVDMQLRLWITNPRLLREVRFDYTERIFNALTEAGIEIPFPHRQLFIDEAEAFEHASFMRNGGQS